jgi:hypothetical protein
VVVKYNWATLEMINSGKTVSRIFSLNQDLLSIKTSIAEKVVNVQNLNIWQEIKARNQFLIKGFSELKDSTFSVAWK